MKKTAAKKEGVGHTPGPWKLTETFQMGWDGYAILGGPPRRGEPAPIAELPRGRNGREAGENKANAHLISAAPELLEAGKVVSTSVMDTREHARSVYIVSYEDMQRLRAAIAKAEGR